MAVGLKLPWSSFQSQQLVALGYQEIIASPGAQQVAPSPQVHQKLFFFVEKKIKVYQHLSSNFSKSSFSA
jgi:hypothetical protein